MYYHGDVKPHRTWDETFKELQHLRRLHEFVTGIFVQAKLNSRALLEQVFPRYEGLFSNIFSVTSLTILARCLEGGTADWIEVIQEGTRKSCSKQWVIKKVGELEEMVAFAGVDPGIFSSGKFTATSTRITKRGSKRLRRSLYLAVQCGIRKHANARICSYYEKKRKEGKPYKVVVIACANKLLHHIFAILQKGQPYQT